ncbi:hypothetical protein [Maliponia aquimaris]|uniref:Uncharacterized protein n=1 Tax=Maliponia aquimaris TaxID=1673631 RepID=A0A238KMB5_9RHOB|nr:hypothetical protein [Maliponia aquimaris]SMX43954.1 hypothetical protein MAA8898_02945 [Maliponia aquimaris]
MPRRGPRRALDPVSRLRYTPAMERQDKSRGQDKGTTREARLKAALKANLARRKAQARARQKTGDAAATADHDDTGSKD